MRSLHIPLLTIALLFTFPAFAQYRSLFGDSLTEWTITEANGFFGHDMITLRYDTTIVVGNDTLHKVDRLSNLPHSIYIKEDLINGKFWATNSNFNTLYLFMDLSLEVGDTLANDDSLNNPQSEVDSVYVDPEGRKRIRFAQSFGGYDHFEMIEGVGTTGGLYKFLFGMQRPSLLCHHKDDSLSYVWDNPLVINCQYTAGVEEISAEFTVYPNPSGNTIAIQNKLNRPVNNLKLLDLSGKTVVEPDPKTTVLSVGHLEPGVYFLQITFDSVVQVIKLEVL